MKRRVTYLARNAFRGETNRYVCFHCRVCFHGTSMCPHCRHGMHYVGTHFRAPRRNDLKAWRRLERMGFSGSFREGCGPVPVCEAEVARYLQTKKGGRHLSRQEECRLAKRGAPVYDGRSDRYGSYGKILMDSTN